MDKKFNTDAVPLSQLLDQATSGRLQLPDVQRSWIWGDAHIARLLTSIMLAADRLRSGAFGRRVDLDLSSCLR